MSDPRLRRVRMRIAAEFDAVPPEPAEQRLFTETLAQMVAATLSARFKTDVCLSVHSEDLGAAEDHPSPGEDAPEAQA